MLIAFFFFVWTVYKWLHNISHPWDWYFWESETSETKERPKEDNLCFENAEENRNSEIKPGGTYQEWKIDIDVDITPFHSQYDDMLLGWEVYLHAITIREWRRTIQ